MATNCTNCGCNKLDCGCKDSFLTTPAPCPTPDGCPDPQPCSEVFDAQCIVYTGDPLECGATTFLDTNGSVSDGLVAITDYICQNALISIVEAGDGIDVTSTTVGNVTTYTITNTDPDQVVTLTAGDDISITGTYPNFTIDFTGVNRYALNATAVTAGNPLVVTHNLTQFVLVSVINATSNIDITSDCTIEYTSTTQVTITPSTFTGNVRVLCIG